MDRVLGNKASSMPPPQSLSSSINKSMISEDIDSSEDSTQGTNKVKSGKYLSEIFRKLQVVYEDKCISKIRVVEWAKRFKEEHESVEDDLREAALTSYVCQPPVNCRDP
ncbi:unnamed protein product [Acanthoscelides obtectus]|uniref:Uncharacterized protein n=1 Tax=Acanthoscelides obtectus TaxID=200917 RepID=A0A9P0K3A7_ACAOB|nr:unnamed protein product [Acanthoscelides obtectus]CAK1622592.1 hypothetical protein AOBTE_LOCUS1581 [Acanthoscelides obtectus]